MGLFTKKQDPVEIAEREQLLDEIAGLRAEIRELRRERGDLTTRDALRAQIEQLQADLVQKQIDYDREKEKWARERREVEHSVGLQKQRADFEHEKAVSEATLKLREENLAEDRRRFDEQLKFNNERYEKTEQSMSDLMGQILERLPTVTVDVARQKK